MDRLRISEPASLGEGCRRRQQIGRLAAGTRSRWSRAGRGLEWGRGDSRSPTDRLRLLTAERVPWWTAPVERLHYGITICVTALPFGPPTQEVSHMATITLRVDHQTRDDLEALARGRGATVSDLLRASIFEMLGRDVPTDDTSSTPLTLTVVERRHLALQHEILAMLHSDDEYEAGYHRRLVEVLAKGYTGEYHRMFLDISPELSRRDCSLLWDLLDMFCVLKASLGRLDAAEKKTLGEGAEARLSFQGFDFNDTHEGRLADYAQHLIDTDRWHDLAEHFDDEHERGNSHSPRLATYLRMLKTFQPIWSAKVKDSGLSHDGRYVLNLDELRTVLAAWPYSRR